MNSEGEKILEEQVKEYITVLNESFSESRKHIKELEAKIAELEGKYDRCFESRAESYRKNGKLTAKILDLMNDMSELQSEWVSVDVNPTKKGMYILCDANDLRGADVVKWCDVRECFLDTYYSEKMDMEKMTHWKPITPPKAKG